MRPRRSTSVISTTRRLAPELASIPRCVRCQSPAQPSSALYWHMGEITMRLANSSPASRIGENNVDVMLRPNATGSELNAQIGGQFAHDATPKEQHHHDENHALDHGHPLFENI